MTKDALQGFAVSKGCKWVGDAMVGSYRGYPFVTRLKEGRIAVLTTVFTLSKRLPGRVGRQVKRELPPRCSLVWNPAVTLTCSGADESLLEVYSAAMDTVVSALQDADMAVPDLCPYCRKGGCDALALMGSGYTPVHRACCEEGAYSAVTRAEVNARQGSHWTGLIGAILGGVAATLPSLLTIWYLERIYAVLFFLIPLGAYYGYRLFRGRMDRAVGAITVIVSLVMPFVLEQAVFYLAVATGFGLLPSIFATIGLYFQYYTLGELAMELALPYVFLVIGLAVTFRQITRTAAHDVGDASAALDSLTPYRPVIRSGPEL